jgi:hypothetical protein
VLVLRRFFRTLCLTDELYRLTAPLLAGWAEAAHPSATSRYGPAGTMLWRLASRRGLLRDHFSG